LILVILLIAVITGLSIPLFRNSFADLNLKNASFNIAKIANYAQEMAIVERASYKLNFDLREGKFWLTRDDVPDETPNYERIKGSYGEDFSLSRGLEFIAFSSQGQQSLNYGEVFFYPDGRCSRGQITIVNKKGQERILSLEDFGSRVSIEERG